MEVTRKAPAAVDAHMVSGVQSVVNAQQVLTRAVQTAYATLIFKHITVVLQNGVVRLTGLVLTGPQRLNAAVVARAIPGVRAVHDDLRLATATLRQGGCALP